MAEKNTEKENARRIEDRMLEMAKEHFGEHGFSETSAFSEDFVDYGRIARFQKDGLEVGLGLGRLDGNSKGALMQIKFSGRITLNKFGEIRYDVDGYNGNNPAQEYIVKLRHSIGDTDASVKFIEILPAFDPFDQQCKIKARYSIQPRDMHHIRAIKSLDSLE